VAKSVQSLVELVRKGSFREDRANHRALLDEAEDLPWAALAGLQRRYRDCDNEIERRKLARAFSNAVRVAHEAPAEGELAPAGDRESLRAEMRRLGPPGSAEQAIGFFPRFLRWPSGAPFDLDGFQRSFASDLYERGKDGRRIFNVALLGVTRGCGKTPFASGLSLLTECQDDDLPLAEPGMPARIFQVAGSREQAGLGTEYATTWIEDTALLGQWLQAKRTSIAQRFGRGVYTVLSSDGRLAHGRKFRRGVGDELWLFGTYREVQSWVALETALHKDPEADLIGISTAGYDRTSLLGKLYEDGLGCPDVRTSDDGCQVVAKDPATGFLMHWYGAPDDADIENPAIVRACNPGSWVDVDAILRSLHRPGADEYELRRLHWNQWTKVKNPWLAPGAWRAVRAEDAEVPVGADIYVAVDAAYSGDCTAVVFAWVDSDGRIHLRARIWSTSRKWAAHEYVDAPTLDNEQLVEPYIRELNSRYRVRGIVFDPQYFVREAEHLAREGFSITALYPQSGHMSDAVRVMQRGVGEGKVCHDGDRVLTSHVEAAQRRKVVRGAKEFDAIDKPPGGDKIDGATAAIMAHWLALGAPPQVEPWMETWSWN
jgi:phage terminase large subunit-like protein